MELRQLVQFSVVAELKNFRRAAERLKMAQPPLSQAIRRLEQALNVQLFERSSRSVELTPGGRVLYAEVTRILAQLDTAVARTRQTALGTMGHLAIGFTVPWAYDVVLPVLRRFRAAHPVVELSLKEVPSSEQMDAVERGTLDIGFLRLPEGQIERDLSIVALREDRLVVALPAAHRLALVPSLRLEELRDEQFILPPPRGERGSDRFSFRRQIDGLCMESGFAPLVAQEASQMQTVLRLVEAEFGIALVPEWTSHHFSSLVAYRILRSDSPLSRLTLSAAWSPRNGSPVLSRFLASLGVAPRALGSGGGH